MDTNSAFHGLILPDVTPDYFFLGVSDVVDCNFSRIKYRYRLKRSLQKRYVPCLLRVVKLILHNIYKSFQE